MKEMLIQSLLASLLSVLKPETVKGLLDEFLDKLEDLIESTETQVDDTVIYPIILALRTALDIPDND